MLQAPAPSGPGWHFQPQLPLLAERIPKRPMRGSPRVEFGIRRVARIDVGKQPAHRRGEPFTGRPRAAPRHIARAGCAVNGLRRPPGAPRQRGRLLWPRGRSSRVRPRGAPSRLPARPGVPGTTRYRVSRRSRRTSGTRVPRPPLALPTRSNNHGPRRTPDTARDIRARRAASPAAPVTPRFHYRLDRPRLTRAGRVPVALPLFPPGVFYQRQPARNRVTKPRRTGPPRPLPLRVPQP